MSAALEYRSYGDAFMDYLSRLAKHGDIIYRYERGEYSIECDQGLFFCTSTEWGWYPYKGPKVEYLKFDRFGIVEMLNWLGRIESWV